MTARLLAEAVEDAGPDIERTSLLASRVRFEAGLLGDLYRFDRDHVIDQIEAIDRRLAVVDRPWENQPVLVALDVDGVLHKTVRSDPHSTRTGRSTASSCARSCSMAARSSGVPGPKTLTA